MKYTDPIAQVVITDDSSGLMWDWTAPKWPYLTGVTINMERGGRISMGSFSIDAPYDAIKDLLVKSKCPFKTNNSIKLRIGYATGGWTLWCSGFLNKGADGLSVSADGISGEISFQGIAAKPAVYQVKKDLLKASGWDLVKLINGIAESLGTRAIITNAAQRNFNSNKLISGEAGKAIRKKHGVFMSGLSNMNMVDILKTVCKEFKNDFWFSEDYQLIVKTIDEAARGTAVNTYVMRGIVDVGAKQFPCFSFSPAGGVAAWFASQPDPASSGTNGVGLDKDTGDVVSGGKYDVKPQDQEGPTRGVLASTTPQGKKSGESVADIDMPDGVLGDYVSAPIQSGGLDAFGNMVTTHQEAANGAQTGTIETLGNPEESVSNACRLLGCGEIFDGYYEISKLTHKYTPGAWDMTLEVFSKGNMAVSGKQEETRGGQKTA